MSELQNIITQITELENRYRSEGDSSLHRCEFLADMFGVDLNSSDYSSFIELKSHIQSVALTDEQEKLVQTVNYLNDIEAVLKNYNDEIKTIPSNILEIQNLDYIIQRVEQLTKNNSRSIDANYLTDAQLAKSVSNEIYLTEKDLSRIKPHKELGLNVGSILSEINTTTEEGKHITLKVKGKYNKVWTKQFFTFQATSDVKELVSSIKTNSEAKAKALKKILTFMMDNELAVRDEIFVVADKSDLTDSNNMTSIELRIGRAKINSTSNTEVIKNVLYRTLDVLPNPMTTGKQEAWVVVL